MQFEFATAGRILFGPGTIHATGKAATAFGIRAFLVHGKREEPARTMLAILENAGVEVESFRVESEPDLEIINTVAADAKRFDPAVVIGIGGGSVIDTGKATAALASQAGEAMDYLEVIGRGKAFEKPSLPFIAIPTTAGTGSEVTRNAVITSKEQRVKVSLRSSWMLPKVAIIDPELMIGMPPAITAATGMDAFTQLLEPYVSNKANQITDMYCREGISKIAGFLKNAYQNGADLTSREQMALAAMYSGIALANSGLGAIHGLAGPLGGLIGASHGALCARLAAPVIEMNVRALDDRDPNHQAVSRYNEISKLVDPNGQGERQGLAGWTYSLVEDLKIPRLRDMGLEKSQFPEVIAQAKIASSMKANPIILEEGDLGWILSEAF